MQTQFFAFKFVFLIYLASANRHFADAWLGINFGEDGDNLPTKAAVVQKLSELGVTHVRIYHTFPETMLAFANSGIELVVGIPNAEFPGALSDVTSASTWVNSNIAPFSSSNIKAITVGNEVLTGDATQDQKDKLLTSMENLNSALQQLGLDIKVTTAHKYDVMDITFPPSAGTFKDEYLTTMTNIASFLSSTGSYMFINIYPYFTYESDKVNIALAYALLGSGQVADGANTYTSLLAQQLDAVYAGLDRIGFGDLQTRVSEIGWPSAGGDDATITNAQTHNQNLVGLTQVGTPLKPNSKVDAYLFAMFNENQKPAGIEQNWGLYHPDLSEVYQINL
ncbi:hypothetical protein Mapa_015623 [Marchantia paleacea]|nr:hypothetical protein Mapa_015623 [Marchantia paleacea]